MTQPSHDVPSNGIPLDAGYLFLVDVNQTVDDTEVPTRRAFVDLQQAVEFIGKRRSRMNVFFAPFGPSTDAVLFCAVEEAFASNYSSSYMLRIANAPTVVIKAAGAGAESEFEPYRRIYPPLGVSD